VFWLTPTRFHENKRKKEKEKEKEKGRDELHP